MSVVDESPYDVRVDAFDDLDARTAYLLWQLRESVFVVEQQCAYQELDGRDLEPGTRHLWVDSPDGPVGYLRLLDDGDHARIGRVLVVRAHRGRGLSDALMRARSPRSARVSPCSTRRHRWPAGTRPTATSAPATTSSTTASSTPPCRAERGHEESTTLGSAPWTPPWVGRAPRPRLTWGTDSLTVVEVRAKRASKPLECEQRLCPMVTRFRGPRRAPRAPQPLLVASFERKARSVRDGGLRVIRPLVRADPGGLEQLPAANGEVGDRPDRLDDEGKDPERLRATDFVAAVPRKIPQGRKRHHRLERATYDDGTSLKGREV